MAELTIFVGNKNYSSWSLRGWLPLRQAGVDFEEVVIPLDRPEAKEALLRASPSARVPVLRHGDLTIWDSLAIGEYLAERAVQDLGQMGAHNIASNISAAPHKNPATARADSISTVLTPPRQAGNMRLEPSRATGRRRRGTPQRCCRCSSPRGR